MVFRELPAKACYKAGSPDVMRTHAHCMRIVRGEEGVREDVVTAIKAKIVSGTYESEHKLDIAVDRLLDDLRL